jgi:hypothetical protein
MLGYEEGLEVRDLQNGFYNRHIQTNVSGVSAL